MTILKLTSEQMQIFEIAASKITSGKNTYYYFPFWMACTERENEFEQLSFEKLPDDLIQQLNNERNPSGLDHESK